jgi:uncharacterized damage-inducible protein DinB
MQHAPLLDALLDSWDRSNTILVNLLRSIPQEAFEFRPTSTSPTIAALFAHIHYVRLVFVDEDAPECAMPVPEHEWLDRIDRDEMASFLNSSARTVRHAVLQKLTAGDAMNLHYDHPVLFLQHMIWHEGYHHGQIKLALKMGGHGLDDNKIGPLSWQVWMRKQ